MSSGTKIVAFFVVICIARITSVWYSEEEMKQAAAHPTTSTAGGKSPFTAGAIGLTLLDTTWRIAVPVILFAGLGIFADRSLGTKPWLTLLAVVIGFVFAGLLLKKQLEASERESFSAKATKDKDGKDK